MKAFIVALFVLVLGDFAINHGNGTHQAMQAARSFANGVSHATSESVFNQ